MEGPTVSHTIPPGEVLSLSSLITPTEGGIASRVLSKTSGGNLTLFALDAGQGLTQLGYAAREEGFRRVAFNVMAANCDDHSKNVSFLLREGGAWELAPAYDVYPRLQSQR
jgi:serine/threonine protein kinase HipA of HipAB toxin-antitoxin module